MRQNYPVYDGYSIPPLMMKKRLVLDAEASAKVLRLKSLGLACLIKISVNQSIYKRKTNIDMKIQKSVTFNGCSVYLFN